MERTRNSQWLAAAAVGALSICCVFAGGCIQPGSSSQSELYGRWRTDRPALRVFMSAEEILTETVESAPEGERPADDSGFIIRADGSFDLSNTIFGGIDGFERLQAKGDRVYLGSAPDKAAGFIEVESTNYTAKSSELILAEHYEDATKDNRTLLSAHLISRNQLLFVVGSCGADSRSGFEAAVLDRVNEP